MPWPTEVPYLSSACMCRGVERDEQKDVAGWMGSLFLTSSKEWEQALAVLYDVATAAGVDMKDPKKVGGFSSLVLISLDDDNSLILLANILNKTFYRLGYTEYEEVD